LVLIRGVSWSYSAKLQTKHLHFRLTYHIAQKPNFSLACNRSGALRQATTGTPEHDRKTRTVPIKLELLVCLDNMEFNNWSDTSSIAQNGARKIVVLNKDSLVIFRRASLYQNFSYGHLVSRELPEVKW